jgi:chromosome segregation protein
MRRRSCWRPPRRRWSRPKRPGRGSGRRVSSPRDPGRGRRHRDDAGGRTGALERADRARRWCGHGLLDALRVTPGHEQALGAALGDDLRLGVATTGRAGGRCRPIPTPPGLPEGCHAPGRACHRPARNWRGGCRRSACAAQKRSGAASPRCARSAAGDAAGRSLALGRADAARRRCAQRRRAAAGAGNRAEALRADLPPPKPASRRPAPRTRRRRASVAQLTEADRMARDARRSPPRRG